MLSLVVSYKFCKILKNIYSNGATESNHLFLCASVFTQLVQEKIYDLFPSKLFKVLEQL